MTDELWYSKYDWRNKDTGNSRNGHSGKTVKSKFGSIDLQVSMDAMGEFEPVITMKHERTSSMELEDVILSLFACGLSTRDIEGQMQSMYCVDGSSEMISRITDKILLLAKEWQNRQLNSLYPAIFLYGIVSNVNQDGVVQKKTAYVVFAINSEGEKEVHGIWICEAESSKL